MLRLSLSLLLVIVWLASAGCSEEASRPDRTADGAAADDGRVAQDLGWLPADGHASPGEARAAADRTTAGPSVSFVSPKPGATLPNPILFTIAAVGVDQVQILADQTYPLAPPWDPAQKKSLLYRFANTGPRSLRLSGLVQGKEVASAELSLVIQPDSCEDRFFVSRFDLNNKDPGGQLDLVGIREESLAAVKKAVADLKACGAKVTLGGMLSLLLYEGGFRAAAYNTRCEENSYNRTVSNCDVDPEALYSYQYGLGAIHTSNFHPCKDVSYTGKMRARFLQLAAAAGFSTAASLLTSSQISRFKQVCPNAIPTAIDHYILGAHDLFGVPRDGSGNHLAGYTGFPFFRASVSVGLTLGELIAVCASISDDRKAITIYGGGDSSYATTSKQNTILALYQSFAAASCP